MSDPTLFDIAFTVLILSHDLKNWAIDGKLVRTFIHRSSDFLGSWISNITVHLFQCQIQINQSLTLIQSMALKRSKQIYFKGSNSQGLFNFHFVNISRFRGIESSCDIS